ncbi:Uncharacterized protein HZ326_24078 [Fusarium oxysporum f. sp. albedinis]|nr:Uncharacterized protein HZ326_24078 [Fusarium oxysporum f. sp. albedinis]
MRYSDCRSTLIKAKRPRYQAKLDKPRSCLLQRAHLDLRPPSIANGSSPRSNLRPATIPILFQLDQRRATPATACFAGRGGRAP